MRFNFSHNLVVFCMSIYSSTYLSTRHISLLSLYSTSNTPLPTLYPLPSSLCLHHTLPLPSIVPLFGHEQRVSCSDLGGGLSYRTAYPYLYPYLYPYRYMSIWARRGSALFSLWWGSCLQDCLRDPCGGALSCLCVCVCGCVYKGMCN